MANRLRSILAKFRSLGARRGPAEPAMSSVLRSWSREFVGRSTELEQFRHFLDSKAGDPWLLWVSGLGGVGKSTLLIRFEEIAASKGVPLVISDNHQHSVIDVMVSLALGLERARVELPSFAKTRKRYEELRHAMLTDSSRPEKLFEWLGHAAGELASLVATMEPNAKTAMEIGGKEVTAHATQEIARYVHKKFSQKDAALATRPIALLTEAFVRDLVAAASETRIVLCWDVFEQTKRFLEPWLLDAFLPSLSFADGVLVVICGRDELTDAWFKYRPIIRHLPLRPFSLEEGAEFLERKGIKTAAERSALMRSTKGLPLLLEWQTLLPAAPGGGDGIVDRFLNAITDEAMKQSILIATVPRRFNRDLIGSLRPPCVANEVFATASSLPGVKVRADWWEFHEVIRNALVDYKQRESPAEFMEVHRRALEYYAQRIADREGVDPEFPFSEEWWPLEVEKLYHDLTANGSPALSRFYPRFAVAIAEQNAAALNALIDAAKSVTVPAAQRERLREVLALQAAIDARQFGDTVAGLDFLADQPAVPLVQKCMLVRATASILRQDGSVEGLRESERRLREVMRLLPRDKRAYFDLANQYAAVGKVGEAVAVYESFLASNPESMAEGIAAIGSTYLNAKKYPEVESALARLHDAAPDCFEEHALRSLLQEHTGQLDAALETHGLIARTFSKRRPSALARIAGIHRQRNLWELVRAVGQQAVGSDPESAVGYLVLIDYFSHEEDFESEMEWLARLQARCPDEALDIGLEKMFEAVAAGKPHRVPVIAEHLERASVDEQHLLSAAIRSRLFSDTQKASELLQRILQHNPSSIPAYCNLGDLYWDQGDLDAAARYFERALDVDSEHPAIIAPLCNIYQALGRVEEANMLAAELAAEHPAGVRFVQHSLIGRCHIPDEYYSLKDELRRALKSNREDYRAQAIFPGVALICDCLDEVLAELPARVESVYGTHEYLAALQASVDAFVSAATPGDRRALGRSMLAPALGRFQEAKDLLRQIDSGFRELLAGLWFDFGMFALMAGKLDEADECLQEARTRFPSFLPIEVGRAVLLAKRGDTAAFGALIESIASSEQGHIRALTNFLATRELFDFLEQTLGLIAGKSDDEVEIFGKAGLAFLENDRLAAAEAAFTRIIANHPETHRAYLDLDEVYRRQGAAEKRVELLESARASGVDSAECLRRLAVLYGELGDAEGAGRALDLLAASSKLVVAVADDAPEGSGGPDAGRPVEAPGSEPGQTAR